MLYVPPISDYKPFYVQFSSGNAKDIMTEYSVIVKAHDYPSSFKPKEPYKNKWNDESGDDEYIGSIGLFVEAFTFKLECAMFATGATEDEAISSLQNGIIVFRNALKNGKLFKTYDAWTHFGFRNVRLADFPNVSGDDYDVWNNCARVIFSVTLKVNDPITRMVLNGNTITTI